MVFPVATALRLFAWCRASAGEVGTPHTTHRGAYPQLRCVWPKRWQHLSCSEYFGATYNSTDTRKPQSLVSDRN